MAIDLEAIQEANNARIGGCVPADGKSYSLCSSDINALIVEVKRLERLKDVFICGKCGYRFMHESGRDRHPCPPSADYDFSAP